MLSRLWQILIVFCDSFLVYLAYRVSFLLREKSALGLFMDRLPEVVFNDLLEHRWLYQVGLALIYLFSIDSYNLRQLVSRTRIAWMSLGLAFFLLASNSFIFYFRQDFGFPRSVLFVYFLLLLVFFFIWRWLLSRLWMRLNPRERIILIGNSYQVDVFYEQIKQARWLKYEIVGVAENVDQARQGVQYQAPWPYLGSFPEVLGLFKDNAVDRLILIEEHSTRNRLLSILMQKDLFSTIPEVDLMPNVFEMLLSHPGDLQHLYDMPLIQLNKSLPAFDEMLNRFFDIVLAVFALVLSSPFLLMAILAIKIEHKGPVFFVQSRVGRRRKLFRIIKLRTMLIHNRQRDLKAFHPQEKDERITALGRWLRSTRLDELPQLWNVIKGDMSFVGPRPEVLIFVKKYEATIECYSMRFSVRPGLTGLAQIYGGYFTKAEHKLKYDLAYIKNRSIFLNLKIIYKTIQVILHRRGV